MKIYKIIVDITFNEPVLLGQVAALIGRMHFNMDYISAIGTLCAGNGLSEIMYAVFGSVEKMLTGKLWPENQRALRQTACELLRPILLNKPEINTMEKLEAELEDLSSKSKTCKMWVDVIIKPSFSSCFTAVRIMRVTLRYTCMLPSKCCLLYLQPTNTTMQGMVCTISNQ